MNLSVPNTPIKTQISSEWLKKQDSTICCLQETYFKFKDTHIFKANDRGSYTMLKLLLKALNLDKQISK